MIGVEVGTTVGVTIGAHAGRMDGLERFLRGNVFSWARADDVVLSGSNVVSFRERSIVGAGSSHVFTQGTDANRATQSTASELDGRAVAQLIGANSDRYDSSLSAGSWKFTNDGTGFEWWMVGVARSITGTQWPLSTGDAGSSVGMGCQIPSGSVSCRVRNASASVTQLGAGTVTIGSPFLIGYSYGEDVLPKEASTRREGTQVAEQDSVAAPSTADPAATLRIGGHPSFGQYMTFDFAELIVANRVNTTLRAIVHEYLALRYGQPTWR